MYICDRCGYSTENKQSYCSHRSHCKLDENGNVIKRGFGKLGSKAWNKGLTKDSDERVKQCGETLSKRIKSGELNIGWTRYNSITDPKLKHNKSVKAGFASVKARALKRNRDYYSSLTEKLFYFRIKKIFPNYTIYGFDSNFQISIYKPDIYIKDLNLIIEIDGYKFHNNRLNKDIERDRFINSKLNCKIRRFDADYVKNYMTDIELINAIFIEMTQSLNYYDRIPICELNYWKWDPYQIGPRNLLTYNK